MARLFEMSEASKFCLNDCLKIAHTNTFQQKMQDSLKIIEYFLTISKKPAISFGGGKDGTAVLILSQIVDPTIRVISAVPPNPLPDREEHISNCIKTVTPNIVQIPYDWDVEAVMSGELPYPEKLKMQRLSEYQKNNGIDGIIWGCRNSESQNRRYNFARNGYVYQVADGTWRCQPIAKWTAEESLALALLFDYPVNPVYSKMDGIYNLDDLHDGTWWAHGDDTRQYWIKKYYSDFYDCYMKSISIMGKDSKREICSW